MFDATEAFFLRSRDEFAVDHDTGGGITVPCVDSENAGHLVLSRWVVESLSRVISRQSPVVGRENVAQVGSKTGA